MYLRFWGTRGSIPTPGPRTAKYGGNTPCVELRADDGTVIILDCGTGARALGLHLLRSLPLPLKLNLFIGHTHWDHIQGFPFFNPAFLPDTELNIYAPSGFQRGVEDVLAGQMQYAYFPVTLRDLRSRIHFTELQEGFFRLGNVLVETQYLNHTSPTMAFRISNGGTTVVYASDHEPYWNPTGRVFDHPGDQRHIAFLKDADLIIHDAQYSGEEYSSKLGWGHSTVEYATEVALMAGAARLALFHHDPLHDDTEVGQLEARAQELVRERGATLDVTAAAEGQELEIHGTRATPIVGEPSALEHRPVAGERVLLVSPHETAVATVGEILAEDGLLLSTASDKRTALIRAKETPPALVIIDTHLPDGDGASLIHQLRARLGRPALPIMLLTDSSVPHGLRRLGDKGATDYLVKPLSPPMLRARVRAWLSRTSAIDASEPSDSLDQGAFHSPTSPASEPVREAPEGAGVEAYARMLSAAPLFQSVARKDLDRLMVHATEKQFAAGQALTPPGQPIHHVYIILSGRVRLMESFDTSGGDRFVGELGQGDIFGEEGVFSDSASTGSAVATDVTRCLVVPRDDFQEVLLSCGPLAMGLLRTSAARVRTMNRLLARSAPDPLTSLVGRRAFEAQYRRLAALARRRRSGVALFVADIQHLQGINDQFGFSVGDEVLRAVADALLESTRTTDLVTRYGADEFAALLIDAGLQEVGPMIERVRGKLEELGHRLGLPMVVRCAIGVTVRQIPPDTVEELLQEAEEDRRRRKS